jgi:hypothetical protein
MGCEMRAIVLGLSLALAAGGLASADEATEQVRTAPQAKKEKVICKERIKANSRFSTRSCMTAAEWEEQAETARSAFSEVQNRPMTDISRGN